MYRKMLKYFLKYFLKRKKPQEQRIHAISKVSPCQGCNAGGGT